MIINNAPQEQAVVSNVNEIGEFRIRNSAKAFNILSSGLYANKIRAIIRELSCNAVDSHVAAQRGDLPFDVHLPNALEPWFSIRDYGTGLSHEQVTNIYTTYFESTKTESNDFIGALGLGSKSPFSYTDNFTVTAVQNGQRGIYTAFINDQGVPSIALMMQDASDEPNGVEVKFSVNDRSDFDRFRQEAIFVYRYFKLRPIISGCEGFTFSEPEYLDRDIIPGVHTSSKSRHGDSVAIMGNIEYPISVPNADKGLGDLAKLLECGLVMEFDIGELDFQASREGLSYVPQTILAIKNKLEKLNDQLTVKVAEEADKIDNLWKRSYYLIERSHHLLWRPAVQQYIADSGFKLINAQQSSYVSVHRFRPYVDDLAANFNIVIKSFSRSRGMDTCQSRKPNKEYKPNTPDQLMFWEILASTVTHFVVNKSKLGGLERTKHHYRRHSIIPQGEHNVVVYVIEAKDHSQPMKLDEFWQYLENPPAEQMFDIDDLDKKPRASTGLGQNVTLLSLEERSVRGGYSHQKKYVWADAGKLTSYDKSQPFYYVPLVGYQAQGVFDDAKDLKDYLVKADIFTGRIFGVRKADLKTVESQKNWINIDQFVREKLSEVNKDSVMGMVKSAIDFKEVFKHNDAIALIDARSPYVQFFNIFRDVRAVNSRVESAQQYLFKRYGINSQVGDPGQLITKYRKEIEEITKRYPLLLNISSYSTTNEALAEYINAIDLMKGI